MNPANSQEALSQLQSYQSGAQNPNDILQAQRNQLGVQGAQDTVSGIRGVINNTTKLLKQVAPSVMGRTASSLVTNAQATKQIANESAPLQDKLGEQRDLYGNATQSLSDLEGKAAQAASGIYQGQQDRISYLQNLYNTLYNREQSDLDRAERAAEVARQEKARQEAAAAQTAYLNAITQQQQQQKKLSDQQIADAKAAQVASDRGINQADYENDYAKLNQIKSSPTYKAADYVTNTLPGQVKSAVTNPLNIMSLFNPAAAAVNITKGASGLLRKLF